MTQNNPPQPEKKRRSLKQEFNDIFGGLRWRDLKDVGVDTLKDLRRPKEIFAIVAAAVTPGGIPVYIIYRIREYRKKQKPSNDDKPPKL